MRTTQNTVLIIGGGSRISFQIAKQFAEQGNEVVITGRNLERLEQAADKLERVTAIACDINDEQDIARLANRLRAEFPLLNMLVNNAGQAYTQNLAFGLNVYEQASAEMNTNYLATVRLTEQLLPLLHSQAEAAIVNVSSVVAYVPSMSLPTYAASKAALHSYTQSLRHFLS